MCQSLWCVMHPKVNLSIELSNEHSQGFRHFRWAISLEAFIETLSWFNALPLSSEKFTDQAFPGETQVPQIPTQKQETNAC